MMKHPLRNKASGFTLIEMLTVITIIIMLAGLTVAGMGYVNDKQARAKAKVDIEYLSQALESYKLDHGEYPGLDEDSPVHGDISEQLYEALFLEGYNSQTSDDGSIKIYVVELDPRNSKQTWVPHTTSSTPDVSPLKIIDPWRRPYRYRKGSDAQNPDFDLWSTGKDRLTNESNPDMTEDVNRDDIRNF